MLALALSLAISSPHALPNPHDPDFQRRARSAPSLEAMPRLSLATVQGAGGESLDQMMCRAANILDTFTRLHGVEGCGIAGERDGVIAIHLTTSGAASACLMDDADVPAGFAPTAQTIHSHPLTKTLAMTPADRRIDAIFNPIRTGRLPTRLVAADPETFSRADREAGPGYLVAAGKLLELQADESIRQVDCPDAHWHVQYASKSE